MVMETIPFVKPVRVGNFKLWRSRHNIEKQKDGAAIECLCVSNLDGSWLVRIPATWEMFSIITETYADYTSEDEETKSRGDIVLRTLLSNMNYATGIGNGFFHRALEMIVTAYAHPSLLEKKWRNGMVKDAKTLIKEYLAWRGDYDLHKEEGYNDEQERKDELASQASDVLSETEEESS